MTVQVRHYRVDDMAAAKNPDTDVRADKTTRLCFGNDEYELDLTADNYAKLRKKLQPYFAAGRRLRARRATGPRTAASRQRSGDIRAWARDHGIEVSDRGRIPAEVIARYQSAHS
jgi:nucleoid-associated protein Lsr2